MHYSAYFTVATYFTFLLFAFFGKVLEKLAQFGWGRALLLKFPGFFSYGLFSKRGPSQQQMEQTRFEMKFLGEGFSKGERELDLFIIWALAFGSSWFRRLVAFAE